MKMMSFFIVFMWLVIKFFDVRGSNLFEVVFFGGWGFSIEVYIWEGECFCLIILLDVYYIYLKIFVKFWVFFCNLKIYIFMFLIFICDVCKLKVRKGS